MTKEVFFKTLKWVIQDIIVPVAVGTSAVVVAIKANQIAELQALIAKNSERPTIEISEHTSAKDFDFAQESLINISILDGKYENYKSDIKTFFIIHNQNSFFDLPFGIIKIPVVEYYEKMNLNPQSLYGTVETFCTYENFVDLQNLMNDLYYKQGSNPALKMSLETYIKITYVNLLNETETVYYLLDSHGLGSVSRINEEQGEQLFEIWSNMYQNSLYISPDTPLTAFFHVIEEMEEMEKENDPYRIIEDVSILP